jgi:site-specific recombinase XerD
MKWDYWICLFTGTHCIARGLRTTTIAAYKATLRQFREYVGVRGDDRPPDQITARDVLEYLEYLRVARGNNASALNRQVTILKNFYRAIVAMGHLEPDRNPLAHFPKIKSTPRKLPVVLSKDEVGRLLNEPRDDTVVGLRDRALLTLLYGTGIRASECSTVTEGEVDLENRTIHVTGKGGHQRTIPLNDRVVAALRIYRRVRGVLPPDTPFFRSRGGKGMSRNAVYERVRTHARRAKIHKRVSPHKLRHTFATHLVDAGVGIVTIRDLLGHRQITSTQIYLHVTAHDLRHAAQCHPISQLVHGMEELLPELRLPFQKPRPTTRYG